MHVQLHISCSFSFLMTDDRLSEVLKLPWGSLGCPGNGIMRQFSSFLIAGMEFQRLSHSWFGPRGKFPKFGIYFKNHVRIITRKYFYSEWYDALRCVIRKLAPNHVSVIFGSEGCQRRVSQGHKMSKNALDAVQGFLRRVSEGAMGFLWWVSVAPNLNSADCQGASYD